MDTKKYVYDLEEESAQWKCAPNSDVNWLLLVFGKSSVQTTVPTIAAW